MPEGRPDPPGRPGRAGLGGWPPEGHIVMTPWLCPNYYPFSVCLIMGSTFSQSLNRSYKSETEGGRRFRLWVNFMIRGTMFKNKSISNQ
jgi:hypothetical protein